MNDGSVLALNPPGLLNPPHLSVLDSGDRLTVAQTIFYDGTALSMNANEFDRRRFRCNDATAGCFHRDPRERSRDADGAKQNASARHPVLVSNGRGSDDARETLGDRRCG